ncbi:ABC transporter substrate-binding protein [Novosphingobium flavum]|uniref:ABC transporter substrate-binding protein n=1 Tax=Novosphingobium flavum TaxID=1778672 RepID=A0A7X1FQF1_9SPHN|nr:ABC transporter substrate-binding protein [Novosphingobium flavum]MBC2665071.1 ABC transporter substrate-binding protein [Novosphingobium flavum]
MRSAFRSFGGCVLGAMLGVLGGCSDHSAPSLDVVVIGAPTAAFEDGVRLPPAAQLVRGATAEGLVALDAQGRVIPALADRWIVTDDGLSYIFRLRDGLWRDGGAITGDSARAALRQSLAALQGTALAQEFAAIDEVRAMAGRVVEIRLIRPAPDLLQLLAQPELGLLRGREGAGPMALSREGNIALLSPIAPERLGLPQPQDWAAGVRRIRLFSLPGADAVRRYAEGGTDLVLGGRFETFALAQSVASLSRRDLRLDPVQGLFGLVAVSANGPLGEAAVREALAMTVDRDALASEIGVGGWAATTRIVATGAPGDLGTIGERWTDLALDRRRTEAAARIKRWEAGHQKFPKLRLVLPEGPGGDVLFARLAADFAAIGVPLERAAAGSAGDLQLLDIVARYAHPEWYLAQLSCAARRGICSAAADARLGEALAETAVDKRAALLAEAEAELTSANVFIPLGEPVRWTLVRGTIPGFASNSAGFHPLPPLAERGE